MQTTIQIVLIVSVVSLTVIFVTVGVWVILILREVRRILNNLDEVSQDVEETTAIVKEKVKQSLSAVSIITALGTLWNKRDNIGEVIQEIRGDQADADQELNPVPEVKGEEGKDKKEDNKRKRRFFRRK